MKKIKILAFIMMISLFATAQNTFQIGLNQDVKQALVDDDYGNEAFNPAFILDAQYQFKQQRVGFINISVGIEYTDLQSPFGLDVKKLDFDDNDYKRAYIGVGYTFNRLPINKLEANVTATIGLLDRFDTYTTMGTNFILSYPLGYSGISLSLMSHFVNRKDKVELYGDDANFTIETLDVDFSGYFGITYKFKSN